MNQMARVRTLLQYVCVPMSACVLTACSTTKPPTIALRTVELVGSTDDAHELLIVLDAQNPNERALPLLDVEYEVLVDGTLAFAGNRAALATAPGFGAQTFVLPAPVMRDAAGAAIVGKACSVRGRVGYLEPTPLATTLRELDIPPSHASFDGNATIAGGR